LIDDVDVLRHGVGIVPVGRDVVRVSGPDAVAYLQGQCSQDLDDLEPGRPVDALLLTPQGKLDALVRVTKVGEDILVLDVDAGYGAAVLARLARFKLRVDVHIEAVDWQVVCLRGPHAMSVVDGNEQPPRESLVLPYVWGGVTGVDVLGAEPWIPAGVRHCGDEAWQAVRIEAGIPVMGAELDDRTIAAEADLLERGVSFTKGCYTGQELVARLDARGNKVARRLRGIAVDRGQGREVPLRPGAVVSVADKVVGHLTSVAWSPRFRTDVALAYVHRDIEPPCAVTIAMSEPVSTTADAVAVTLPFPD
jgi:folate-binding protein YgfZ